MVRSAYTAPNTDSKAGFSLRVAARGAGTSLADAVARASRSVARTLGDAARGLPPSSRGVPSTASRAAGKEGHSSMLRCRSIATGDEIADGFQLFKAVVVVRVSRRGDIQRQQLSVSVKQTYPCATDAQLTYVTYTIIICITPRARGSSLEARKHDVVSTWNGSGSGCARVVRPKRLPRPAAY